MCISKKILILKNQEKIQKEEKEIKKNNGKKLKTFSKQALNFV